MIRSASCRPSSCMTCIVIESRIPSCGRHQVISIDDTERISSSCSEYIIGSRTVRGTPPPHSEEYWDLVAAEGVEPSPNAV